MLRSANYTIHNYLKSLEKSFDANYKYEGMESLLSLSNNGLSGNITGFQLMPGLSMIKNVLCIGSGFSYVQMVPRSFFKLSFYLDADLEVTTKVGDTRVAKSGSFRLDYYNGKEKVFVKPNQPDFRSLDIIIRPGSIKGYSKQKVITSSQIPLSILTFFTLRKNEVYTMPPHITYHLGEIWNNKDQGLFKILNLQSKVCDLLYEVLLMFDDDKKERNSSADSEKMYEIKNILECNYHKNHSLKELAKAVGVNENKLKKEFKATFGTTIFQYLSQLRMRKSRKMLLGGLLTINEIAESCGYHNTSKFITAFKKYYGATPGQLRSQKLLKEQV